MTANPPTQSGSGIWTESADVLLEKARSERALGHLVLARLLCAAAVGKNPHHSEAQTLLAEIGNCSVPLVPVAPAKRPPVAWTTSTSSKVARHNCADYTIDRLIQERPPFYKDDSTRPVSYAIHSGVLRFINSRAMPGWRTYETGAGASTIAFLIKGCRHTAVMPDPGVKELIESFARANDIEFGESEIVLAKSQWHLPSVAQSLEEQLDMVIIDGDHAFPMPYLDYYYLAGMVKQGGYLVVDNVDLYTGESLMKFLRLEPFWRIETEFNPSSIVFRKVARFEDRGWSAQIWPLINGTVLPDWALKNVAQLAKRGQPSPPVDSVAHAATLPTNPNKLEQLARRRDQLQKDKLAIEEQWRVEFARINPLNIEIRSCNGVKLEKHILDINAPWVERSAPKCSIPGMITTEEKRYYGYLTQFYSGHGRVLELGPWLGCSTWHICGGLRLNPAFSNEKLYVVDDFIWRSSWMDGYYKEADRPANHGDFRPIYERHVAEHASRLATRHARIAVYDGNDAVDPFTWDDGAIEMCFVDCGRPVSANEAWYNLLRRHFIRGKTLLILQDWQTHKEVPEKWNNQMKQFTESKGVALEQIHELRDGGVATFLYHG